MDDDIFAQSHKSQNDGEKEVPWKILIVDDSPDIHDATKFALRNERFLGRGIEFFHAYSGAQALEIAPTIDDLALIFLDVVMETDNAGLKVARSLRTTYGAKAVRIVLRTGQPGSAPERSVIVDYDINDYKEKTELTSSKLFVTLIAALRSYQDIRTIESLREFAYQRMAVESEMEQSALDQLPLAVIYADSLMSITRANRAAGDMLGQSSEELLGRSMMDLLSDSGLERLRSWHQQSAKTLSVTVDTTNAQKATIARFGTLAGDEGGFVVRLERS